MWRLVLRVFPLALLSMVAALMIVVYALYFFMADEVEEALLKDKEAQIYVLQDYLTAVAGSEAQNQRIAAYQSRHQGSFGLTDGAALTPEQRAQLQRGETVVVIKVATSMDLRGQYYFPLATGQIMHLADVTAGANDLGELEDFLLLANLSVLALFLFFLSVWSAFHWAELKKLMQAMDRIGAGDFSARARLSRYASTYMVAYKVNRMASYIEHLVNGQRELIHSVSHELRTPIARLNFGLVLLDDGASEQKARIQALLGDVDELATLVDELLQLASVGQQYLGRPQSFDVQASLLACVPASPLLPQNKHITVAVPDGLGQYEGDVALLERVWKNLLGNAVKYGHSNIRFSAQRLSDHSLLVCVEDDGPGIPEIEYARVLAPFYRVPTVEAPQPGYGLGLAMVQKIVALHQGTLRIDRSALLGGAKLVVCLPPHPRLK
ncbi:MAG: hypothetical protein KA346_00685 [Neisseriaceae bacterium]|nr:hypothetical protein [Neisseriaceae bacterium]